MGDDAVQALIGGGGRHHDHLALGLRQSARLLHQRIVVGEERAKFLRAMREREEDVRHEAGLLLHPQDAHADVLGQFGEGRNGEAADGHGGHRIDFPKGKLQPNTSLAKAPPAHTQPMLVFTKGVWSRRKARPQTAHPAEAPGLE